MAQYSLQHQDRKRPLTIGLMIAKIEPVYQGVLWQSCAERARELGINFAVFSGGPLRTAPGATDQVVTRETSLMYDDQGNFVYQLPTQHNFDGLIIVTTSLGNFSTFDEMITFCNHYEQLPVVSLGFTIPGINSVVSDSATGIREAVTHQIQVHGHRKIAFIRGPEHHAEAKERLASYRETLQANGIAFDPTLSAPGDYISIDMATSSIQRWLRQGVQSIIAANDTMALATMEYIQSLGIKVPNEIAVIGFDDDLRVQHTLPPLSTVHQPLAEMAERAVDVLLAHIEGHTEVVHDKLPSRFIVRQSCGCSSWAVPDIADDEPQAYLKKALPSDDPKSTQAWVDRLWRIYSMATASEESAATFREPIESIVYELESKNIDFVTWLNILTQTRQHIRTQFTGERAVWLRTEHIWDMICTAINQVGILQRSWRNFRFEHINDFRDFVSTEVLATYDEQHLEQVLSQYLKHLNIPNSYIVTFPEAEVSVSDITDARVIVNTRRNKHDPELKTFQPTHDLLPASILNQAEPWHIVVAPLYSQTTKLGYVIFEAGSKSGDLYQSLRSELSSAVMSIQLVRQLTNAYIEVEERVVNRTAELVEQMDQLTRVETAREAIYEISEAARNSQDIQDLYPQIHHIVARLLPAENFYIAEVNDETQMISFPYFVDKFDPQPEPRSINSQTVTSLVIRRQKPLLVDPDTFDDLVDEGISALVGSPSIDWLGVPLTLHDHTFGALVVQTYDPGSRYTEDDLNLLNFVSDQVAQAISRVRTDEERNQLLDTLQRRTRQLEAISEITRLTAALRDVQDVLNDTVNLIQERFGFYFTGIYLIQGEPERAVLRAASGDIGKVLLNSGHSLAVGGPSMIGQCTAHGEARVATDVSEESMYYANPWLPATRSEMALPLLTGSICIGAVTVQSAEVDAFDEDDIRMLQTLIDHIAITIENASLHERIQNYTGMLEAEVQARTADLQAINTELSTFAYSVSHDLRAPLRRIDGFSEAVIEDYAAEMPQMAQDYLRRVRQSAQHMNALIEAMLELSRVTRSELYRSDVDMSAIAMEILTTLRQQSMNREVELIVPEAIKVNADPRLLHIVLDNLLGNAWKFTRDAEQARIEIGCAPSEDNTTYFVRDNGVGFDPRYAEKLFAPFQRLHDIAEFEGTGIGLATVQRVIRRHGGRIWAESEPGKGATFYFSFG